MSAAPSPVFGETPQRQFPRRPLNVPLDLIALRSGIPENLPGRCTDLSEAGVGVVVAGELAAGQQVALALRLPNTGVSIRARALVRYQSRSQCGLVFVGLAAEQREAIRHWMFRSAPQPTNYRDFNPEKKVADAEAEAPGAIARRDARLQSKVRIGRRGLYVLLAVMLALAGLGWWQWQSAWNELEGQGPVAGTGFVVTRETVSAETMAKRIVTKVDPVYPEAARAAGTEGLVVLDAVIASDGSVKSLRPLSGPDLLAQAATEAVRGWKFEPYLSSGSAVEVETTIAVEFRLN